MKKIIFSGIGGEITDPIVLNKPSMFFNVIYIAEAEDFLKLRTLLPYTTRIRNNRLYIYYELNYFIEMLYEGSPDAFNILTTKYEDKQFVGLEYEMIEKKLNDFISIKLVDNLLKKSDEYNLGTFGVGIIDEKNEKKVVKNFGYSNKNAYLCIRELMLAEQILKKGIYDKSKIDIFTLNRIYNFKYKKEEIKEIRKKLIDSVNFLKEKSVINYEPDLEFVNDLILSIRNVEIIDKNVEL